VDYLANRFRILIALHYLRHFAIVICDHSNQVFLMKNRWLKLVTCNDYIMQWRSILYHANRKPQIFYCISEKFAIDCLTSLAFSQLFICISHHIFWIIDFQMIDPTSEPFFCFAWLFVNQDHRLYEWTVGRKALSPWGPWASCMFFAVPAVKSHRFSIIAQFILTRRDRALIN